MSYLQQDKDFLYNIKRSDPRLQRWVLLQGQGNVTIGVAIYLDAIEDIKQELAEIYYELTDLKMFSKFFRESKCDMFYKNSRSMLTAISKIISRNYEKTMRYKSYARVRKIVNMYNEWREKNER